MTTFADLGLAEEILAALQDVGYESPSPIQEQAIPLLLEGRDVIGQAQTGTGKTAAFGLPMIESVDASDAGRPGARPHADARAVHPGHAGAARVRLAQGRRPGGRVRRRADPRPAGAAAGRGPIVVGTVGRVLDLISRHSLMLHSCRYVVLDEADEMLDLGFLEDVEKILSSRPTAARRRCSARRCRRRSARSPSATCTTR